MVCEALIVNACALSSFRGEVKHTMWNHVEEKSVRGRVWLWVFVTVVAIIFPVTNFFPLTFPQHLYDEAATSLLIRRFCYENQS